MQNAQQRQTSSHSGSSKYRNQQITLEKNTFLKQLRKNVKWGLGEDVLTCSLCPSTSPCLPSVTMTTGIWRSRSVQYLTATFSTSSSEAASDTASATASRLLSSMSWPDWALFPVHWQLHEHQWHRPQSVVRKKTCCNYAIPSLPTLILSLEAKTQQIHSLHAISHKSAKTVYISLCS